MCECGNILCSCFFVCLCPPSGCNCLQCSELRRKHLCQQCGHPLDSVRDRYRLPDLSFLNNPTTSGASAGSAEPDEPGKSGSKHLTPEEKKELYSQPMIFQMDDIDSSPDERESEAPHFISIRSQPNPCIVVSQHDECVSEQTQDKPSSPLATSSKSSETLPSGLSDESTSSFRPTLPESSIFATSALSSFSASPPRIPLSSMRSASALPDLRRTLSTSSLDISNADHMHDVQIASDTSSSIETISMEPNTEMSVEEKLDALRISAVQSIDTEVKTASEKCKSAEGTSEQCTEMSLKEQSAAVEIPNPQFKHESDSDSCSSVEVISVETESLRRVSSSSPKEGSE